MNKEENKIEFSNLIKKFTLDDLEQLKSDLVDCENHLSNLSIAIDKFPELFDQQISDRVNAIADVVKRIEDLNKNDNETIKQISDKLSIIERLSNKKQNLLTPFFAGFCGSFLAIVIAFKVLL